MRTCKVCGASIEHKKSTALFCSIKCRRQTPDRKAYNRERKQTPEYKAYERERKQTPEYRAYERASFQKRRFSQFLGWMYAAGLPEANRQAKGVTT